MGPGFGLDRRIPHGRRALSSRAPITSEFCDAVLRIDRGPQWVDALLERDLREVHVEQLLAGSRARHGLKATFASEVSPKIPVNRSGAGAQAVRAWLEASPHHPRSARIYGYHPSPGGLTAHLA